jgi:hypothetical protein
VERLEDRTVPSTVQGTVFNDLNQDGIRDPGEPGIANWFVYLDADQNGQWSSGETSTRADAAGAYSFTGLAAGSYTVASWLREPSYARTQPASGSYTVTFASGTETITGLDFGNRLTARGAAQPEFRVNTTASGSQSLNGPIGFGHHTVAADGAGNFIVVWEGNGPGDPDGVFAQRYWANGTANGSEVRVNTTTTGSQRFASVAADANGNFVVVWQNGTDVKARLYYSNGNARTGEFLLKSKATINDVAMDATGDFVVSYQESKNPFTFAIYAQRYNAAGSAQGKAINFTTTNLGNDNASVAMDSDGDFVVAWTRAFQRVDRFGTKQGAVVNLPGGAASGAVWPVVAMDAAGNFVVAYADNNRGFTEARLYFADGTPRGDAFSIDPTAGYPAVAMGATGEFAVAWLRENAYEDIFVRRFDAVGTPLGDSVVANATMATSQTPLGSPAVAMARGTLAVVWHGPGPGDDAGVFGQRYNTASPLQAAGGPKINGAHASVLRPSDLDPQVQEAVRRWQTSGELGDAGLRLRSLTVQIANLPGGTLGLAAGNTIWLDDDAAGWGWFVDPTPWSDSEFTTPGNQSEQGRMDLLTVLMHEMGHVLGLEHDADGVMQESLSASTRHLPTTEETRTVGMPADPLDRAFPSASRERADLAPALSMLDRYFATWAEWDAFAIAVSMALDPQHKN